MVYMQSTRVAQAAGVSSAAPYHHFADKQALLDAIATEGFCTVRREMLPRMEKETDPRARTQACGIAYIAFALHNPALFRLMFSGDDRLFLPIPPWANRVDSLIASLNRLSPQNRPKEPPIRSPVWDSGRSCMG
jgi:AcrR family transcriptional regulator